jgi:hypothetical protein
MDIRVETEKKINEFLGALSQRDVNLLDKKFGVSEAMLEEIDDAIYRVYDGGIAEAKLSAPESDSKFGADARAAIEVFERDTPANEKAVKTWGVECHLLSAGRESDLTLLADVYVTKDGEFEMQFNLIEVQ